MIQGLQNLLRDAWAWAAVQPLFIQIPLGVAVFVGGIYVLGWILGLGFLALLRVQDRRRERDGSE